jgi:hypothetical protein
MIGGTIFVTIVILHAHLSEKDLDRTPTTSLDYNKHLQSRNNKSKLQ